MENVLLNYGFVHLGFLTNADRGRYHVWFILFCQVVNSIDCRRSLSCGLKEDVTGDQLQFTAMAIFSRYRWLKASEVMLFFFNFKAGFYERFYSYFDTQTIIRSFKAFLEERALAIAAREREVR